eukprot:Amastigsp_a174349_697.p3 type:complete len:235 gc:universal Amastigsp_a174349_697:508-1212(+)
MSEPVAAAVFCDAIDEPMNTPWSHESDWLTSGIVVGRRPPKMIPSIGTPSGESYSGSSTGQLIAGTVNREFGCAAGLFPSSFLPSQLIMPVGRSFERPSHHTSPSRVSATFVNSASREHDASAFGLVLAPVPGATPKYPNSGFTARRRPSASKRIHAMSSPTHSSFQPGSDGSIIARFVLPHADGNAAAKYFLTPCGEVRPRMSMCSANQPSFCPMNEAMRSAYDFLPRSALPP